MSKKIAMLQVGGYYDYVVIPDSVPPQGILDLMSAQSFRKDYNAPWKSSDKLVEVIFIDSNELPIPENQAVIDMREIMAENNRLTRENENLLAKLAKAEASNSTDLAMVGGSDG